MNNEQIIDKLRKELLLTRIFSVITSLLMIGMLVGGYFLYTKAQGYIAYMEETVVQVEGYLEEVRPAMEQLVHLDVKEFNETLVKMNKVVDEVDWQELNDSIASVDWEKVSKQLEAFDVEALNEAIAGLDTKELTNALETMNNAVDKLRKIADAFSNFAAKFGFGVN